MHETILNLLKTTEDLKNRIESLETASRVHSDEIVQINNAMAHTMMQRLIMKKQLERLMNAHFGEDHFWQENRSPAPSGNTSVEVPAEHRSTCTGVESADSQSIPTESAEPSTSIPSETPATVPMAAPGESDRTVPIQTDAPTHFQEEPLWEYMLSTCRRTCRDEFYSLVSEVLREIVKRSTEAK